MPSLSKMAAATLALTSALLVVDVPGVSAAAIRGVEQTEFCSWEVDKEQAAVDVARRQDKVKAEQDLFAELFGPPAK
ncbi:hypothetical protein BM221_010818 [Beauveria bassiana]|uniref:Uncharacterized protein n=1 Tax=Beauveria bassiana TaxID=176275 RepID=A0A2N6N7V7_BEABA|nr:hypothetical protein BM221_010818 [Beauveria bassiana]